MKSENRLKTLPRLALEDPLNCFPRCSGFEPISSNVPHDILEQTGPIIPDAVDRRRSTRQPRRVPAWLSDASGGSSAASQQEVIVADLSLHGVGFTAAKRVVRNDSHWIVIASDNLSLSTRLRVVSCRENPDGTFEVGAEFY